VPQAIQQVRFAADAEVRAQTPVHLGHRQVLDRQPVKAELTPLILT
jgi:hypothetical protein